MNLNVMDGGKHFVREGVLLPRTETYVQSGGQRWTIQAALEEGVPVTASIYSTKPARFA
jgi:6-phosphogluconate dehydrogenase (decarboxylating)